jgi:Xaa-Pro aminopeptidase
MGRERLDALVVAEMGRNPSARYLTNLAPSERAPVWAVIPRQAPPVAIRRLAVGPDDAESWVERVIDPPSSYAETALELLSPHLGQRSRLGVAGTESADGGLRRALRAAELTGEVVDVAVALEAFRARRSPEEVALLAASARALDTAFAAMDAAARPDMRAHELWSVGVVVISRETGELPRSSRWASAARPRALARPTHGLLVDGFVATCEFEAAIDGYATRAVHSIGIGRTGSAVADLYAWLGELWLSTVAGIHPGADGSRLQRELQAAAGQLSHTPGVRGATAWFTVRGGGLGADLPRLDFSTSQAELAALRFEAGAVCSLGVWLRVNVDGRQYLLRWEDAIALTADGVQRLGSRVPGRLATGEPRYGITP